MPSRRLKPKYKIFLAKLIPAGLINFKIRYDWTNIGALELLLLAQKQGFDVDIILKENEDEA